MPATSQLGATRWLLLLALAIASVAAPAGGEPVIMGIGNPKSECFVALAGIAATTRNRVECTDGDPACDVDGTRNGRCTFHVRVCIALPTLEHCHPTSITSVAVAPTTLGIALPPVPASTITCGESTTITVPLGKRGRTAGRLKLVLTATNAGTPDAGEDVVKITCRAAGAGTSTSTTTTTTVAASTTTLAGQLLVNGDFALPVDVSPSNGWRFADIEDGGWASSGGNPGGHFVLNQSGQGGTDPTLSQAVSSLVVGATYRLAGEYRSYMPSFGDATKPDAFAVRIVPQPSDHTATIVLELPRPSPDPLVWTPFHVDFVASAATATISFEAERDGDDSSFDLDNLTLAPKP